MFAFRLECSVPARISALGLFESGLLLLTYITTGDVTLLPRRRPLGRKTRVRESIAVGLCKHTLLLSRPAGVDRPSATKDSDISIGCFHINIVVEEPGEHGPSSRCDLVPRFWLESDEFSP